MFTTKLRIPGVLLFMLGLLAVGGRLNHLVVNAAPVPAPRKVPKDLLEKRREAAQRVYLMKLERYKHGIGSTSDLLGWSERYLEADLALVEKKADQIAALKAHLDRTREVERITIAYFKAGGPRESDADAATYDRVNAEIRMFEATGKIPPPPVYDKSVPSPGHLKSVEKKDQDEREAAVEKKKRRLQQEIEQAPQRDSKEAVPAKVRKELLNQRLDAARRMFNHKYRELATQGPAGIMTIDFFGCSERWLEAELALSDKKEDQIAALKAHAKRTREIERLALVYAKAGAGTEADANAATFERINADIRYFQATGEVLPPPPRVERQNQEELSPAKEIKR